MRVRSTRFHSALACCDPLLCGTRWRLEDDALTGARENLAGNARTGGRPLVREGDIHGIARGVLEPEADRVAVCRLIRWCHPDAVTECSGAKLSPCIRHSVGVY